MIVQKVKWVVAAVMLICTLVTQMEPCQADDLADANTFLTNFLSPSADHRGLTKMLRPSETDYHVVFIDTEFAKKLKAAHDPMWESGTAAIAPKSGQTKLLIWSATIAQLRDGSGSARYFPGGYSKVSSKFSDWVTVICWKFVKPGETIGMAYNGLIRVNGQWRFFPKPWRVLEPENYGDK